MTEHRYDSDHDGERAYVFDNETKLRAYFPDSAAAFKAMTWMNAGITGAEAAKRYRWQAGNNSVYVNIGNGDWGHAVDLVTIDVTDQELELIRDMGENERIEWAHNRHHEQLRGEG